MRQEQRLGDSNKAWAEEDEGRAGEGGSDGRGASAEGHLLDDERLAGGSGGARR